MAHKPRYFTIKMFTRITFLFAHGLVKYQKKMRLIDSNFKKEIMVAVSSVNKCAICSHVHTKALLKARTKSRELADLYGDISDEKRLAILFAQHYADTIGDYDKDAFVQLVDYYGRDKAYGIMTIIQMIMFGNANGIALTNLLHRLTFKRNKESTFGSELFNGPFAYLLVIIFLFINLFTKKKTY